MRFVELFANSVWALEGKPKSNDSDFMMIHLG